MVRAAIIAITCLFMGAQASAEDKWVFTSSTTGSRLMAICGKDWSFGSYDPCGAYLTGIIDGLGISGKLCPPNIDTAVHQMSEVAYRAVKDQPEKWHLPAIALIEQSLTKSFGCR